MRTAKVKQEEEAETRIIEKRVVSNMEGWNVGTIRNKSLIPGLINAKDVTLELPEGHESSYHRLD